MTGARSLVFKLAGKLSGAPQLLAILFIEALTLSKPRRKGDPAPLYSDPITLAQFAERCGCTKEHAWRMLTDAKKRGLLTWLSLAEAKESGLPAVLGADPQANRYRLLPEKWESAPAVGPKGRAA